MQIKIRNWIKFQHYKHRNPPWIKLHKTLLDDYTFNSLNDASKMLLIRLWLLASEDENGVITSDISQISYRLRLDSAMLAEILPTLQALEFIDLSDDACAMLAACLCDAAPETETETETEKKKKKSIAVFDRSKFEKVFSWFWKSYALSEGRGRSGNKSLAEKNLEKSIKCDDDLILFCFAMLEYFGQVDAENAKGGMQRSLKLPEVFANQWSGYLPEDHLERLEEYRAKQVENDQTAV